MPELDGTAHCASPRCRGSILWVETVNGKRMPVDYLPHVDGTILVELDETRGVRTGRVLTGFDLVDVTPGTLHRHHRASCTDPDFAPPRRARR